jgi:hypothetical protein
MVQEGGTGTICFRGSTGYIKKQTRQQKLRQVVFDHSWQDKRAQHAGYQGVQSLQEQEFDFGKNISTAAAIFHHKKRKISPALLFYSATTW